MLKNFTWGHGIVVALGSFMIFILSLIWYFTSTWKNSELITDNYYEEELAYQNVIDAKNKAINLKELPVYHQNESGISVTFPSEINNSNSKFRIDLHRAEDQKLDIIREMELDQRNSIFIPAKVLAKGNYVLRMMWKKDNEEYQIDYDLIW